MRFLKSNRMYISYLLAFELNQIKKFSCDTHKKLSAGMASFDPFNTLNGKSTNNFTLPI